MKKQKFATEKEMRHYKAVLRTLEPGTQNYFVLNRLIRFGYVTTMQAFQAANITRLSARIYELRNDYGIPIEKEMVRDKRVTYAVYYIGRGKEEQKGGKIE